MCLTQIGEQANLRWDCAHQAVIIQLQVICGAEMQVKHGTALELQ